MDDPTNPDIPQVTLEEFLYAYLVGAAAHPLYSVPLLLFSLFHLWMLIDSFRRRQYLWSVFLLFPAAYINTILYYFLVFRSEPIGSGFSLNFSMPGSADRARIKQLEADIHNLDKAHHYQQLGDIYLRQGKLSKAEGCFKAALEREPEDDDSLAHMGVTLSQQKKLKEALPFLQKVVAKNPRHDYGETAIAYAEVVTLVDEAQAAQAWQLALGQCSLPRAKVQYAEVLAKQGKVEEARKIAQAVVADAPYTPAFQAVKDRPWVARAKRLLS
jgi:hypothetical protein